MTASIPTTEAAAGFLFPGQGAQRIGMGTELEAYYATARTRFDEAAKQLGFSLRDLCANGPEAVLNQDVNAQLALYVVSCIITDILREENITAGYSTGYSSGFYAAAYAAGCFDFVDGLSMVRDAGEILLEAGRHIDGGMAVIFGLSADHVLDIIPKNKHVGIAIQNTPRQIVLSGTQPHLQNVMDTAVREGALDAYLLPVGTAYHSSFMRAAGQRFFKTVHKKNLRPPRIPLYSYATLKRITDTNDLRDTLAGQLSRPVLWVDLIKKLRHNHHSRMVEIGSGTLISRTVRWIDRTIAIMNTDTVENLRKVVRRLA